MNLKYLTTLTLLRPPKGSSLRVSRTYFNGLQAPKDKIAVLQGSIASSGLQKLYFVKFEKIAMGIVWAPGLQGLKMMGSRAPATPLWGPHCLANETVGM